MVEALALFFWGSMMTLYAHVLQRRIEKLERKERERQWKENARVHDI